MAEDYKARAEAAETALAEKNAPRVPIATHAPDVYSCFGEWTVRFWTEECSDHPAAYEFKTEEEARDFASRVVVVQPDTDPDLNWQARAEAAEAQVAALWVSVNSMQQLAQRALAEPISADTEALVEICTVADDVLTPEIASTSKAYEKRIRAEAETRMLERVCASLREYPNGGGDIEIMQVVDDLLRNARRKVYAEERDRLDKIANDYLRARDPGYDKGEDYFELIDQRDYFVEQIAALDAPPKGEGDETL
jgi:hypothetical protein